MPDIFFITGDYKQFLKWIDETRNSLLALNKYNPSRTSSILDTDVLKKFVETRVKSYGYETASKFV
jgi:hypothetical protein